VDQVGSFLSLKGVSGKVRYLETALQQFGLPFPPRLLGFDHNLQDMIGVFRGAEGRGTLPDTLHYMAQAIRPLPEKVGLIEILPGANLVLP
jgi:hypothetical protein